MPLLWAFQEAVERVLRAESFPFAAAREPEFLKGLAMQALFGVLAVLVAGHAEPREEVLWVVRLWAPGHTAAGPGWSGVVAGR